ncbi:MAG: hypothetical protein ACXAAO_05420 [Candidatus Thorarchaeota archaeon]
MTTHELDQKTEQSNIRTSLAFIRTIDAEKRTHLAELRTGIGILTIPMSLLTILIATSSYYSVSEVLTFIIGLVATAVLLILIGGYLVYSSLKRILGDNTLRNKCDDLSGMVSEYNGFHDDHD